MPPDSKKPTARRRDGHPVNLAEERERREALPRPTRLRREIDHTARAWCLSPDEARAEAERYAAMADRFDGGDNEPWARVWRVVAEVNRQRAAAYATAARRRLDRGRVA